MNKFLFVALSTTLIFYHVFPMEKKRSNTLIKQQSLERIREYFNEEDSFTKTQNDLDFVEIEEKEFLENKLIKIPSAELLRKRFNDHQLPFVVTETQIIQQLADIEQYPFTISVIVISELLKLDKGKSNSFYKDAETIMELLFKDLPKTTIMYLKFVEIIPYKIIP